MVYVQNNIKKLLLTGGLTSLNSQARLAQARRQCGETDKIMRIQMKTKTTFNGFLSAITLWIVTTQTLFAQTSTVKMYMINDSDGYVNVRSGAGMEYDVNLQLSNKRVVYHDPAEYQAINGWIPYGNQGYIHESRLISIEDSYVLKLEKESTPISGIYMLNPNIPHLFLIYAGSCDWTIVDVKNNRRIFSSEGYPCFDIIWSDTLSFTLYNGNGSDSPFNVELLNPIFAVYKLYEKNGEYDFYTEIYPEPRRIPKEEAEELVESIRNNLPKYLEGIIKNSYKSPVLTNSGRVLFLAYCSGVDAWDIISNLDCNTDFCRTLEAMRDAYDRSKLKPK